MRPYWRYILVWAVLLGLLLLEILSGRLLGLENFTPLFGVIMALVVAVVFMRLPSAPAQAHIFAFAAVTWLVVMLAMTMIDPVTRTDYLVSQMTQP